MFKQEIVIWGTGKVARQFFYEKGFNYDIKYFIDNYQPKYKMKNLKVYHPKDINLKQYKIIIAMADWESVAKQLKSSGLIFIKDYVPYYLFDKDEIPIMDIVTQITNQEDREDAICTYQKGRKIALINGNCQTSRIKQYLKQNKGFRQEYVFLDIPAIYLLNRNQITELMENSTILKKIKLFISQNISLQNSFDYRLSNQYLISLMDNDIKYIRIPNLYFDVYFPNGGKEQDQEKEKFVRDMFPYNDAIIDELQKSKGFTGRGYEIEEIIQIVTLDNLFSHKLLCWILKYRIQQLKEREDACDIKIMDYIEKYYLEKQLFYSRNHPINDVLKVISTRLLKYINEEWSTEIEHEETIPSLALNQEFIYPSVAQGLKVSFVKKYYSDNISECKYNIEDEIKKYIFSNDGEHVKKQSKK